MPSRPWLQKVRHLLGEIPDREVARRAGVSQTAVTRAREQLGITSMRGRTLASYTPDEVRRLVRLKNAPITAGRLNDLCRYHFGSVGQAIAGQEQSNPRPRPLTSAMLRGAMSSAELERLTGVSRGSVRSRREAMGIRRNERRPPNRAWLPGVRKLIGKIPDIEIAKRVHVKVGIVKAARTELGITAAPKRSAATSGEWLRRMSKAERRKVLAGLDPVDAKILEARYLRTRPVTLAQLGAELGISRQRVAQKEARLRAQENW